MLGKRKNIDMTQGVIWRQLSAYAIPILIGELFQLLYTTVDSITVGNFVGANALAAIGASETIVKVLIGFFNGMEVGFIVGVARFFGAKDREGLNRAVNGVLQLGFLLGLAITAGGLLMTEAVLRLMNTPDTLLADTRTYLFIYFAGASGFVLYNTAAAVLKAVGDVRTPLLCLLISSAMNILLDLVMVIFFHMGVSGVAFATILSQCTAAIIAIRAMIRHRDIFTVAPLQYRLNGKTAALFLRLGIPTGFQKSITAMSNVLVLTRITFFGEACLAGWTVYNKLDHIMTVFAQSIGSALSTFVSQNLGAVQYKRLEKGVRVTFLGGAGLFLVLSSVIVLLREPLVRIFGSNVDMIYYGERFVLYITFFKLFALMMNVYAAALRGTGRMTLVTIIMLSGIVVFRQIYLVGITAFINNPWLVGMSYPVGWLFAGVVLFAIYRVKICRSWRESARLQGTL